MSESAVLLQQAVDAARAESRQAAARLDAIAEFVHEAIRADGGTTDSWAVDAVGAATVDIAAALRISRGLADWQVRYAYDMHHRLPRLAERFRAGDIGEATFRTAAYRTALILDDDILARVDAILAHRTPRWGSVGRKDMHHRIDKIVSDVDADAVRHRAEMRDEPGVTVTPLSNGMAEITVVTTAVNANATSRRLTALAHSVCENDPRTLAERRADAHAAAVQGADRLSCRCGQPDCPAGGIAVGPAVIHVVADEASIIPEPAALAESEALVAASDDTGAPTAAECRPSRKPVGGIISGCDGLIPPELIVHLAPEARLRPLIHPGDAGPEPGSRPSQALADFIRARDLTCRWPHCDVPADNCDIDHVIAHGDHGPTQAADLACFCRHHHLLRTCGDHLRPSGATPGSRRPRRPPERTR